MRAWGHCVSEHAKLPMTLFLEVDHGKSIHALQILEQVESVEKVNEEVSQEGSKQVEQARQS
jgi:hypothetical protein